MTASESILRDLGALQLDTPPALRERVRALGEPQPRRMLPLIPWRRATLVLVPACALALVSAAVVHGVLESGHQQPTALERGRLNPNAGVWGAAHGGALDKIAPTVLSPTVSPTSGRRQDYQASMTLRVRDLDALTDRTNEAMQVVRSYGGYVASVRQSTSAGAPGEADLTLRIPVGHVEDAMVRLSELGTVLARQVSIVDLEQTLRQQRAHILQLKLFIARAAEQLQGDLPADVRIRLQLQLQQARSDLTRATRSNKATLNEAAFSHVSLTLTTQKTGTSVPKGSEGRFERAARDAGSFLAAAGAVVLFLLIVLTPLIVLVVACALGWRTYRRREERRLLAA